MGAFLGRVLGLLWRFLLIVIVAGAVLYFLAHTNIGSQVVKDTRLDLASALAPADSTPVATPVGGFGGNTPTPTTTTTATQMATPTATSTVVPATASATATATPTQTATKLPATATATASPTPTMTPAMSACVQTTPPVLGAGVYAVWNVKTCKWDVSTISGTAVAMATPPVRSANTSPVPASLTPGIVGSGSGGLIVPPLSTVTMGAWKVQYFAGATAFMRGLQIKDLAPNLWATSPDSPNPLVPEFRVVNGNQVPDGVEWGQQLSTFGQFNETADFEVAPRSHRVFSGDYNIDGIGNCGGTDDKTGCALVVFNMGNNTALWRNAHLVRGYTHTGLYWNGDQIQWAIWGLSSHTAYRMMVVDPVYPANPGGNCSVPEGCGKVLVRWVITSGNEVLVMGESTVTR